MVVQKISNCEFAWPVKPQIAPPKSTFALPRLILIDGPNVAHCFNDCAPDLIDPYETRHNLFVVMAILTGFLERGFPVRIVYRNLPTWNTNQHPRLMALLWHAGIMMFPPNGEQLESDDRYMLELAKNYGAYIISNDAFKNHSEYVDTAAKCRVGFRRASRLFNATHLPEVLHFACEMELKTSSKSLYSTFADGDYEKVVAAHKMFLPLSEISRLCVELAISYIHGYLCFMYAPAPPTYLSQFSFNWSEYADFAKFMQKFRNPVTNKKPLLNNEDMTFEKIFEAIVDVCPDGSIESDFDDESVYDEYDGVADDELDDDDDYSVGDDSLVEPFQNTLTLVGNTHHDSGMDSDENYEGLAAEHGDHLMDSDSDDYEKYLNISADVSSSSE